MKKLPTAKPIRPKWENLKSPLDLDTIETEINDFYVPELKRLVAALCLEIRELRE